MFVVGIGGDVSIEFNDPVQKWGSVDMTCSYESNTDRKYVQWYRHINGRTERFLLFLGTDSYVVRNQPEPDFEFRMTVIHLTSYLTQHMIRLNDVAEEDEGLYWCTVSVVGEEQVLHSPSKALKVVGGK